MAAAARRRARPKNTALLSFGEEGEEELVGGEAGGNTLTIATVAGPLVTRALAAAPAAVPVVPVVAAVAAKRARDSSDSSSDSSSDKKEKKKEKKKKKKKKKTKDYKKGGLQLRGGGAAAAAAGTPEERARELETRLALFKQGLRKP